MSFYNTDPRAYFQWNEYSSYDAAEQNLNNLEVGRLIRILDSSDENKNYKIYTVDFNSTTGTKQLTELKLFNPDSLAIGKGTNISLGENDNIKSQMVVGQYNAENDNALFIVGNGSNGQHSNIFEVLDNGICISGKTLRVDDNGHLEFDSQPLTTEVTLQNKFTYADNDTSPYSPSTQAIGTVTMKNGDDAIQGGTYDINFPSTITVPVTFSDITTRDITINEDYALTTKEIKAPNNDPPNDSTLTINTDGSTIIGKTISASGTKRQKTKGLSFGDYSIEIVTQTQYNAEKDSVDGLSSNTIYIVIQDPSDSYSS